MSPTSRVPHRQPLQRSRLATRIAALLLLLGLVACGGNDSGEEQSPSAGGGPSAANAGPPVLGFTDVSKAAGLTLENVSGDPAAKLAIVENIGQGSAALDFDGDGDLDLFVANGDVLPGHEPRADPRPALYRNDGDLRFTDVTEACGLMVRAWMHGAYAVDFDADHDPDLFVTVFGGPNLWFRNDGGTFTDVSAEWGANDPGPSSAAAFFDADQDGDLDLYLGAYVNYDPKNPPNGGEPCLWKGLQVSCGPRGTEQAPDKFFENVDGRLVEATAKFGFEARAAYTLAVVAADVDGDGLIDVFVSNDSVDNYHFINQGGGKFVESGSLIETASSGSGHAQAGMGADFGDIDNDGRLDLYITHFSHDFNTLYHNELTADGRTMFFDATDVLGLKGPTMRFLSWGTAILDLDRDGWRDLIIASGHVYPQVDQADLDTSYAQRNQVFINEGKKPEQRWGRFKELIPDVGDGLSKAAVSRGLTPGDFDEDGDIDLFFTEMDGPPTLLRNDLQRGGAWIGIALRGAGKNTEAIGARVEVTDSAGLERVDQRTSGDSYFSTADPRLFFGLGAARGQVTVRVRWPDGTASEHAQLDAGRYWTIDQTKGRATPYGEK